MVEQVVVGIDVSKAKLDVALLPNGEQFTVSNDRHGIGELLRRVSPLAPSRVVLEATGKLEQLAVSELAAAGLPVVVINPAQVRHYAKARGVTRVVGQVLRENDKMLDLAKRLGFEREAGRVGEPDIRVVKPMATL